MADRIEEYAALGISQFILSGYPHLEEAYWFGEGVLPELRRRGRWAPAAPLSAVSGVIAPETADKPGERNAGRPGTPADLASTGRQA